jgi:hypothetical protein
MLSKYFFTELKKITAHAQNFSSTLLDFENKRNEDGQSELKILVSVVRFRPGPPRIIRTLELVHRISSLSRGLAPFPKVFQLSLD